MVESTMVGKKIVWKIYIYLENKGFVFKARWYKLVRLDITQARPLFKWIDEGIALVISRQNNGHAHVLSGRTNNTFILILKNCWLNM